MAEGLIGKRKEKGTWMKYYSLWTKVQIRVLAYFDKYHNKSATYRTIARAYKNASYTNYKKACDTLHEKGYLDKLEDGSFNVNARSLKLLKTKSEFIEMPLPFFSQSLKQLK